MRRTRLARLPLLASIIACAGLASCGSDVTAPPDASASAVKSAASSAVPPAASNAPPSNPMGGPDEIKPVYPIERGPPNPDAQRFCEAVHVVPANRLAECCNTSAAPATLLASECTRVLTYAIAHDGVTLAPAEIDACAKAITDETSGCDWVVSAAAPVPAACTTVVKGSLDEGKPCRSSLECRDGLQCGGLSAVDMGKCAPPKTEHPRCNVAIDTLASLTRQDGYEARHRECEGYCQRRCEDAVPPGGKCTSDLQCGHGRCAGGKCTDAPLPADGAPCPDGACASGARCVKGTCAKPKAESAACTLDEECRGKCVRDGKAKDGICAKSCIAFEMPTFHPSASASPKPR